MVTEDNERDDSNNVLLQVGKIVENFVVEKDKKKLKEDRPTTDLCFSYSRTENFIVRSQLDAKGALLPDGGVVDIKSRATFPIRMDMPNYKACQMTPALMFVNALLGLYRLPSF